MILKRSTSLLIFLSSFVVLLGACAQAPKTEQPIAQPTAAPVAQNALAILVPTQGNKVRGVVNFQQVEGGVRVVADVTGLRPNSVHGFHIHEFGDCSDPKAEKAGGHYNPEGVPHGGISPETHKGDMANLNANARGRATYEQVLPNLAIAGAGGMILGRAVIVHAKPDDLTSQPTGGAGDRLACGAIALTP